MVFRKKIAELNIMENELEAWRKAHKFYSCSAYLTKDLAAYLKVSPRTVQRWLKGKTHPKETQLGLIKKYLSENSKNTTKSEI